jgi:hypothetical protein
MAYPLSADIKQRAEKLCAGYENLELPDPGTLFEADGRIFVAVKERKTGLVLWLEVPK